MAIQTTLDHTSTAEADVKSDAFKRRQSTFAGPIRIMHVVYDLGVCGTIGGMENGVINICQRLPKNQFSTSITALMSGGSMEQRIDQEKTKLYHVERNGRYDPFHAWRLARLLRQHKVQVLHTHNWGTLLIGMTAAKLARTPIVIHGEHGKVRSKRRQILAQRYLWMRSDRLLAVSDALADRLTEHIGYPREAITVIANGVDIERFRPCSSRARRDGRASLGFGDHEFVIGMVARLVKFKNHLGALQVLKQLLDSGRSCKLVFVGDGPLRTELEKAAHELRLTGAVSFLGTVDRVEKVMPALDVLLSNSLHHEGMSNAILEGMASGLPVISTRISAAAQMLEFGVAGMLIPPGDRQRLYEAICQLSDDTELQMKLSQTARDRILLHHSLPAMVQKYEEMYLDVVAEKRVDMASSSSLASGT